MQSDKSERDSVQLAGEHLLGYIQNTMSRVDWPAFLNLADMIPDSKRVFVTGAGRSGLVARMFAMRLMHAGLTSFVPGETTTPAAGPGDLLVAISCTGTTGYTEYLTRRASELGARTAVLTSEITGSLSSDVDLIVEIPTPPGDIVLRAAVFEHATSLCLDAVFNVLSQRMNIDELDFRSRHANLE